MSSGSNLSNSVGWQKWNMSKRVSSANNIARIARKHVDSCQQTRYWAANDLSELERLTRAMEDCAVRAEATWSNVEKASSGSGVVSAPSEGHSKDRDDSERLDRVLEAYRAGNVTEYWDYVNEFKHVMIRAEWENNRRRWNVIGKAQRQRSKTKIIAPAEGSLSGDAPTNPNSSSLTPSNWYMLTPGEADELRRLTSLLSDCAREARRTFATICNFLEEIDPDGRGASLWTVPQRLEERMLTIRLTDSVVEESVEIEKAISALLGAAAHAAQRTD